MEQVTEELSASGSVCLVDNAKSNTLRTMQGGEKTRVKEDNDNAKQKTIGQHAFLDDDTVP